MGIDIEWFKTGPELELHASISGGVLTLSSGSALLNPGDFLWNPDQVVGVIAKNGTVATSVSINSSTGALTASNVSVSTGDVIEVRLEFTGPWSWPHHSRAVLTRVAVFTVPAGNSTVDFDANNNVVPVIAARLALGWDGNDQLGFGVKLDNVDGASVDLTAFSRRLPVAQESSTTIQVSNTSTVQVHTSSFSRTDVGAGKFEVQLSVRSSATTPRMEDRLVLRFHTRDLLPLYPASFPSDDVTMALSKVDGKVRLGAPGQ